MTSKVILTAIGGDRPGLTQALADAVFAAGGNWLESHLSHLGGQYVGSILVELADDAAPALEKAIRDIAGTGLYVSIVPAGETPAPSGAPLFLELVGQDRPGIVREVTAVLTRLQVNIEDFATSTEHGSWSGEPIFRATARLAIPHGTSEDAVRSELEAISGEIMVDFSITPSQA
jgi:glycine cleavage system regulatory protein